MANLIAKNISNVDAIISSPAVRAITTAQHFANAFNISTDDIITDLGIYEKNAIYVRKLIANQNDDHNTIALVGHNPMITNLVIDLTNKNINGLEPCSVVQISFNIEN
jgi:phosphohistidine phosphatase